jgi:hypothetical protein
VGIQIDLHSQSLSRLEPKTRACLEVGVARIWLTGFFVECLNAEEGSCGQLLIAERVIELELDVFGGELRVGGTEEHVVDVLFLCVAIEVERCEGTWIVIIEVRRVERATFYHMLYCHSDIFRYYDTFNSLKSACE